MAEVNVSIHGKPYGISCDDGQEDRVLEVGRFVDARVKEISRAGAATNENHLLVLTSLVLADEIKELSETMEVLKEQLEDIQTRPEGQAIASDGALSTEQEQEIIQAIEYLQNRLNSVSQRLQAAA